MKRMLSIIFAISLIAILSACNAVRANGNVTTETHNVRDFKHISIEGIGEIYVTVGEAQSVSVSTDENLHQYIEVEVRGNTLHLGQESNVNFTNVTEIVFTITVPELESLNLSGAGSVEIEGVEGDSFTIDTSGATDIELLDVDVNELRIEISGSGSATADGRADELFLGISGAGEFTGFDLDTEEARIEISGAGSAEVNVSNQLRGEISGAGDIRYRGNPNVNVEQSGAGRISSNN